MIDINQIKIGNIVVVEDGSDWVITETVDCIDPHTSKQVTVIVGKHNNIERAIKKELIREIKHKK